MRYSSNSAGPIAERYRCATGTLGYLTLGPAGQPLPVVSTLNSLDGTIVSNAAFVPATNGTITAFASNPTDLVVDVNGYFSFSTAVGCTDCPDCPVVQSASVGQNLQTPVLIQFPAGTTSLAVSSGDPSRLLVAARDTFAGSGSINLGIPFGVTSVVVYAQALAGSGTVTLNATGNGGTGSGTITLTPSGFVFIGPNGPVANFSTDQGVDTPLPISAARLDGSLNFVAIQQVRAGLSVSVNPTSSNPAVGTVAPVTFDGPADTVQARFTAVGPGSTTLTTGAPAGFSAPNQNASVTVSVNPASLSIEQASVVIGQNLETDARVVLAGAAPGGGLTVNITSNDPSRLLLSADPTPAGAASIQFVIPGGNRTTPMFYVQALAGSGNASYTASASGFGNVTQTLTLAPSGFVISGPFGFGNLPTTIGAANSNITVFASVLDGSLNFAAAQSLVVVFPPVFRSPAPIQRSGSSLLRR